VAVKVFFKGGDINLPSLLYLNRNDYGCRWPVVNLKIKLKYGVGVRISVVARIMSRVRRMGICQNEKANKTFF
jgi:hypothetical protein